MIKESLKKIIAGQDLNQVEAANLLTEIIDGAATDAQIAALLVALALKGETVDELTGFAQVMRQRAAYFAVDQPIFIDTAGTGGDGLGTFNISTTAAFVIAGAGIPVAKHGNRAVSSLSGSADILSALGVKMLASPTSAATCLNQIGICFMLAPAFHPATKRVAEIRRQLGIRTAFNLLGPLTNPARTPRQLMGVFAQTALDKCAQVLARLGSEKAWVVWGADGLDEISLCAQTHVAAVDHGTVTHFTLTARDFGYKPIDANELRGGTPTENAQILQEILTGQRQDGLRAMVIVNAAAAIYLCDAAPDLFSAVQLAQQSIDSGQALNKLNELVALSDRLALKD